MDQVPNSGCKKCPNQMPYAYAYNSAMYALEKLNDTTSSVVPIMAIALKETSASPWFAMKDQLFNLNCLDVKERTQVSFEAMMGILTRSKNARARTFPKFRYEPGWLKQAQSLATVYDAGTVEEVIMSCSWGVGQKAGLYYLVENELRGTIAPLVEFIWSPELQWQEIARMMRELLKESGDDLALAATRYNAGAGAHLVNSYGRRVVAMATGIEALLSKGGYPLCSVGTKNSNKPTS